MILPPDTPTPAQDTKDTKDTKDPLIINVKGYKPMQLKETNNLLKFAKIDNIDDLRILKPEVTKNLDTGADLHYTEIYDGIKKLKKSGKSYNYTQEELDRLTQHKERIENDNRRVAIAKALKEENKRKKAEEDEKKKDERKQKKELKEAEEKRIITEREERIKNGQKPRGRQQKNNS